MFFSFIAIDMHLGQARIQVGLRGVHLLGKLFQNHAVFNHKLSLHLQFWPQSQNFLKFTPPFSKVCVRACRAS